MRLRLLLLGFMEWGWGFGGLVVVDLANFVCWVRSGGNAWFADLRLRKMMMTSMSRKLVMLWSTSAMAVEKDLAVGLGLERLSSAVVERGLASWGDHVECLVARRECSHSRPGRVLIGWEMCSKGGRVGMRI